MKERFLWNARRNGSVKASTIRNFTIEPDQGIYLVVAWMSDSESIKMGIFDTEQEAQVYLDSLHKQIEVE